MSDFDDRLRSALTRARAEGEADPTSAKRTELQRRVRSRRLATWATTAVVIAGLAGGGVWASDAIGDGEPRPVQPVDQSPSPSPEDPTAGPSYSCGGPDAYRLEGHSYDHDEVPPAVWDEFASIQKGLDPGIGPDDPLKWNVVLLTDERVEMLHGDRETFAPGGGAFHHLSFERGPEGWEWAGSGECDLRVIPEGRLEPADWVLAEKPQPDDTVLQVDATEIACASARKRPPEDFVAKVEPSDLTVSIQVFLKPRPMGAADCPGNPSTRIEVRLGEPLGNRLILDAAVYPPRQVYSPPPIPSYADPRPLTPETPSDKGD